MLNVVKAGAAVPLKFSLGGDYGLDVLTWTLRPRVRWTARCSTRAVNSYPPSRQAGRLELRRDERPIRLRLEDGKGVGGTCRSVVAPASGRDGASSRFQIQVKEKD